jgi:hypothetical protein
MLLWCYSVSSLGMCSLGFFIWFRCSLAFEGTNAVPLHHHFQAFVCSFVHFQVNDWQSIPLKQRHPLRSFIFCWSISNTYLSTKGTPGLALERKARLKPTKQVELKHVIHNFCGVTIHGGIHPIDIPLDYRHLCTVQCYGGPTMLLFSWRYTNNNTYWSVATCII